MISNRLIFINLIHTILTNSMSSNNNSNNKTNKTMASILTLSENELWLSLPTNLTLDEIHRQVKEECKSLKHPVKGKDLVLKGVGTVTMAQIICGELRDSYNSCIVEARLSAY